MALDPAETYQGPLFIGIIINIVLYGIMINQTFLYFMVYKNDARWIKIFVAFLFITDTVNSVVNLIYIYDTLIRHFGDVDYLANLPPVIAIDPALTGIIAGASQLFFAWRIYVLSRSVSAVVVILACTITNILTSIGTSIGVGIVGKFAELQQLRIINCIWLASAAIGDVLIAGTLVWYLSRRRTGFAETDNIINRIMRLTVQTGLITAICAVTDLVCYMTITSGIHLIFNIPLAKLYSNSLLSSLNSRGGWKISDPADVSNVSNLRFALPRADNAVARRRPLSRHEVSIFIESDEAIQASTKVHNLPGRSRSHAQAQERRGQRRSSSSPV
ncbi:hypothetical protein F5I97DRAFT_1931304 [Phlebopus sp. FC_14]|nr:hypothetical protein F5I97DRAFT_1931304 [Phlebopus sp. FC_14]